MANITVYEFLAPDIHEGEHVPAKGKATREFVESIHGEVIEHTAEIIDSSLLNTSGRYHAPLAKDQPNQ
jgi:hypothetical protein